MPNRTADDVLALIGGRTPEQHRIVDLEAEVARLTDQNRLLTKIGGDGLFKVRDLGDRITALETVLRRMLEDPCLSVMNGCAFHEPEACPIVEARRLLEVDRG